MRQPSVQQAVDQADPAADRQRQQNCRRDHRLRAAHEIADKYGDQAEELSHRKIDQAGGDDEGLADGEDRQRGRLVDEVDEIAGSRELGAHDGSERGEGSKQQIDAVAPRDVGQPCRNQHPHVPSRPRVAAEVTRWLPSRLPNSVSRRPPSLPARSAALTPPLLRRPVTNRLLLRWAAAEWRPCYRSSSISSRWSAS